MKYLTRKVSLFLRFFSSSSFGKCVLSGSKKVLCLFFALLFIFSLSLTSFAEDLTLQVSNLGASMQREVVEGSITTTYNYQFIDGTTTRSGVLVHWFRALDPSYYAGGGKKLTHVYDSGNLSAGHDYEMTFYAGLNFNGQFNIRVFVGSEKVFDNTFRGDKLSKCSVHFTTPTAITDSTRIQIVMSVPEAYSFGANGENVYYYFSENLEFADLTDNPRWLAKIRQWFQELGDKLGGFFTSLGDRISGFFTNLTNSISQWFAEQKKQIQDFFNGVKQWFQELGDRIQQFFVDLYNDIVEGLKSLFIPSEGYFDSKKTELENFCLQHFGALYQAPDVILDFVNKFVNLTPKQPSITLPAIQFDFNGTRYVLSDAITYSFSWVNDSSHPLFYFYKFYRGFATLFLFFFFGNYCIKKYNEVFAGGEPD